MGAGATCYGQSTDGLKDKCKAARSSLVARVKLSGRPVLVAAPVPRPRPRPRYSESDAESELESVSESESAAVTAPASSSADDLRQGPCGGPSSLGGRRGGGSTSRGAARRTEASGAARHRHITSGLTASDGNDGDDGDAETVGDGHAGGDGADGAATVTTTVATAAVATAPSLRDLIAAKIDESEAAHAAEKATLSARIAALEDEKRCAAAYNDDELAPHTIARKWETLRTLADTLTVTVRKSVHAITVQRDGDGRLGLASVRAVLDKFVGWKKWQTVLQPLSVKFESEAGVDECGLTRELFALLFDRLGDLDLFEVMSCDDSESKLWRVFGTRHCITP